MDVAPDWQPWRLGLLDNPPCGGHSYAEDNVVLGDVKKSAERAFRSTGRYQVVHLHRHGERCAGNCIAYGDCLPRLEDQG